MAYWLLWQTSLTPHLLLGTWIHEAFCSFYLLISSHFFNYSSTSPEFRSSPPPLFSCTNLGISRSFHLEATAGICVFWVLSRYMCAAWALGVPHTWHCLQAPRIALYFLPTLKIQSGSPIELNFWRSHTGGEGNRPVWGGNGEQTAHLTVEFLKIQVKENLTLTWPGTHNFKRFSQGNIWSWLMNTKHWAL